MYDISRCDLDEENSILKQLGFAEKCVEPAEKDDDSLSKSVGKFFEKLKRRSR